MLALLKNKKLIRKGLTLFTFLAAFLFAPHAFAATLNLEPTITSYRVGDTIRVRVSVASSTSINAVSGRISFPPNLLTLTSISKSPSLISLWAQEPSYSNSAGTASLEGVILNGYTGNGGTVATLVFKAKAAGTANVKFATGSVLANDGSGTETLSGKYDTTITITKALPKAVGDQPEKESVEKELLLDKPLSAPIPSVTEIKNVVQYFSYRLFVSILLVMFLLLCLLFILFTIHYKDKVRVSLRKKLSDAEDRISKDFDHGGGTRETERKVLKEVKNIKDSL